MQEIRNFLEENGYILKDLGNGYWTTTAHYRDGTKSTSLNISQKTGSFKDWVTGIGGSFKDLVCIISGVGSLSDAKLKELLSKIENAEPVQEKIKVTKKFDKEILETFLPDYRFFARRHISEKTQKLFKVGFCTSGKMRYRYILPIICHKTGTIVGLSGRYYKDTSPPDNPNWSKWPKWKHLNPSKDFLFPMHLNDKIIREKKEIIFLESPGDTLALWEMGKQNTICLFGTQASSKVINYICSIQGLKKIWICLNDDKGVNKELAGNRAAGKLKKKLSGLFREEIIEIAYPPNCNDWSDYWAKKNSLT